MSRGRHGVHQPRVGIVGGGQLARMLTHAAERLDVEVRVLAKPSDTSMAGHDPLVTVGDPDAPGVLEAFAAELDVVTFENELVAHDVLVALEATGVPVRPGSHVLAMSNKAHQRRTLSASSFPLPPFVVATEAADVEKFAAEHGWPVVVKSATGGYDGRGVHMVDGPEALATLAFDGLIFDGGEYVVEPHLDIDLELAVLVARRPGGESTTFPVVETVQRRGMCREVHVPSGVSAALEDAARMVAEGVAGAVDAVGMLAVELFVVDGEVIVNELAPRVHNSGHLTIEACHTSQFEQHLRAVADLPLGSTALRVPAATMVNVVGDETGIDPRDRLAEGMAAGNAAIHLYGKAPRPERKIGHVTATATDRATAHGAATAVARALMSTDPAAPEAP